MPRNVSYTELCRLLAEKRDLHRRALAAEAFEKHPDDAEAATDAADLGAKLREWLSFAYVGKTGEEPRASWVQLSIDEAQAPSEGSGVYVVIDGTIDTGTPCAFARYRDPKDRDPQRERTTQDEIARTINNTLEQARIGEERANRRANEAISRLDMAEQTIRAKDDEIRLLHDRIAKLENSDDGGTLATIITTALPYVQNAIDLYQAKLSAAERRQKDTGRAERAFELLAELAEAVEAAPGGRSVMRDRRVRAIADTVREEFGEEADDVEEEEAEAEKAGGVAGDGGAIRDVAPPER